jgi:hypothetical protein
MERCLAAIWSEFLCLDRVGIDDDFFELGGDSLLAVELVLRIEAALARSARGMASMMNVCSSGVAACMSVGNEVTTEWVRVHSGDDRPPLLCLPGIDGTGFGFDRLCASADPLGTAFAFPYPGIFAVEEPLRRVEALAQRALAALPSVHAGPYFCGGPFGGLVAYEMHMPAGRPGRGGGVSP